MEAIDRIILVFDPTAGVYAIKARHWQAPKPTGSARLARAIASVLRLSDRRMTTREIGMALATERSINAVSKRALQAFPNRIRNALSRRHDLLAWEEWTGMGRFGGWPGWSDPLRATVGRQILLASAGRANLSALDRYATPEGRHVATESEKLLFAMTIDLARCLISLRSAVFQLSYVSPDRNVTNEVTKELEEAGKSLDALVEKIQGFN